jgi:GNAT superfamily N-acetyltransferase
MKLTLAYRLSGPGWSEATISDGERSATLTACYQPPPEEPPVERDESAVPVTIDEWEPSHPRRGDLMALVDALGQTAWVGATHPFHRSSHLLVATSGAAVVGFLRLVVQEIGPDAGCPPVRLDGRALTEAKILAFGVAPTARRRGIGRALQGAAIERARALGCHQVRSHSGGTNTANHRLKLALGFGVHPITRGDDVAGAYFILPLRPAGA